MSSEDFKSFTKNYVEYLEALAYDNKQIQTLGIKLTHQ